MAVLVLATHIMEPLNVGIDNKTVVDKANKLVRIARDLEQRDKEDPKKLLKKFTTLQGDGDLWQQKLGGDKGERIKQHKGNESQRSCN